jgi:hypothetical protein
MMDICTDWKAQLLVEYSKNKFSCEVMDGQVVDDRYRVLDDLIFYKDWIYLVLESTLKGKILKVCQDSPTVGHQGYFKTYRQEEHLGFQGVFRSKFEKTLPTHYRGGQDNCFESYIIRFCQWNH